MSTGSNKPNSKLGLDARAAELKEKLLRSRDRAQTGTPSISMGTNSSNMNGHANGTNSSAPSSSQPKPSLDHSGPGAISRTPLQTSIAANSNEIADFITSISSTSSNPAQTANTKESNLTTSEAGLPTPIPPADKKAQQSGQTPAPQPPEMSVLGLSEEGEVESVSRVRAEPSRPPKVGVSANFQQSTSRVESRPGVSSYTAPPSTNAPIIVTDSHDRGNWSAPVVSRAGQAQTLEANEPQTSAYTLANACTRRSKSGNADCPVTSGTARTPQLLVGPRLLDQDPDLKDWLELTGYDDEIMRKRKLERYRKAQALAAEKERIEDEQRKLMEEDELDMVFNRSGMKRLPSATPTFGQTTSSIPPAVPAAVEVKIEQPQTGHIIPAKRYYVEGRNESSNRPEKTPRPENTAAPPSRVSEVEHGDEKNREPRQDSRSKNYDRDLSPARYPRSPPRRNYRQSPPPRPREYSSRRSHPLGPRRRPDFDEFDDRERRYDHYPEPPPFRRDHVPPTRVDLGKKGDTRFFILKSFSEQNVHCCMEDGLWATQVHNVETLTSAFAHRKNVILFFSVNGSKAFQGYARMLTAPSPDTPRPRWMSNISWDTSDAFRVEWLSKTAVDFFRVGHLKNPLNEDRAVLIGKDGQEIEEECGRRLLEEMQDFAEARAGGGRNRFDEPEKPIKREQEETPQRGGKWR